VRSSTWIWAATDSQVFRHFHLTKFQHTHFLTCSTGALPAALGQLVVLRNLILRNNQLVGAVPAKVAQLALQRLDLDNNPQLDPVK
jgi:hypothetical protein